MWVSHLPNNVISDTKTQMRAFHNQDCCGRFIFMILFFLFSYLRGISSPAVILEFNTKTNEHEVFKSRRNASSKPVEPSGKFHLLCYLLGVESEYSSQSKVVV
ncbi:hypothetical protein GOODEAATRI_004352 [Goodea atripinnis]|uniref:Uncharacterized protein n=1 Tax=Goodea atripinnis TaxID=208336 RepID=A0ABV0PV47_9TELE